MLSSTNLRDWLFLERIVRFGDTDAAGVIHFYHLLRWSHEAWEESLQIYGLKAKDIFPSLIDIKSSTPIALPIVHCEADFRVPITTGDHLDIKLLPEKINISCFQIRTQFKCNEIEVALGLVRHLAIDPDSRQRCDLPEGIALWLEDSST